METRLKVKPQQGYNLHNKFTTRSQPFGNQVLETVIERLNFGIFRVTGVSRVNVLHLKTVTVT